MIDDITRREFLKAAETLKNEPDYMQNFILLGLCKTDRTGTIEPIARKLAEYGMPVENVGKCVIDIMAIFASN